jgi:hypothetical protein
MKPLDNTPIEHLSLTPAVPVGHLAKSRRSKFILAAILFCLLNALLSKIGGFKFDQFSYPSQGWAWWLVEDLKNTSEQFNIALFGSSLMMSAVTACDSEYLNKPLPVNNHRSADYFDAQLNKKFDGEFYSFNCATPGQMPSDACLFLRILISLRRKPAIIIYGIAPRDFIDNTLSEPSDTEPAQYLTRLVDVKDLADHIYDSWETRFTYYLERPFFLCGHSLDLQMKACNMLDRLLAFVAPCPRQQSPFTKWDRMKLVPEYKPMENSAYTFREVHGANVQKAPIDGWSTDNTNDYIQRYRCPNEHGFQTQLYFLDQLAQACKQNEMQLILVNMPLSAANVALFTNSRYTQFLQRISNFAMSRHIAFYNLSDSQRYSDRMFRDSVHLNGVGGKELFDQLTNLVANDKSLMNRFAISGKQLRRATQLASYNRGGIE